MKLLIVGNPKESHVGHHFRCAAEELGLRVEMLDLSLAFGGGIWQKVLWRWDRLAARHKQFQRTFLETVESQKPGLVLVTGMVPIDKRSLEAAKKLGATVVNFLTDDPWNIHHQSKWFLESLPSYQHIFTPRQANVQQLKSHCASDSTQAHSTQISVLRFGYNPNVHFIEKDVEPGSGCDVLMVGGADKDRVPYAKKLLEAGLSVTVFGGYWDRVSLKGLKIAGQGDMSALRRATRAAKVSLILVRRANRDGHVMRTFEAWACGGCLLVENTDDHQSIFEATDDEPCVSYFRTPEEAAVQASDLTRSPEMCQTMRNRLAAGALQSHSYQERLRAIVECLSVTDDKVLTQVIEES